MTTVTLIDGREADSASEEWRHQCEANAILNMPCKGDRRCYLDGWTEYDGRPPHVKTIKHRGILQRRGPEAVAALEATILLLWKSRSNSQ